MHEQFRRGARADRRALIVAAFQPHLFSRTRDFADAFGKALAKADTVFLAEIALGTAEPTDIDAVYVVGIGGGDPGPLLAAQADSGRLGIVSPGSPTSTVDGRARVVTTIPSSVVATHP